MPDYELASVPDPKDRIAPLFLPRDPNAHPCLDQDLGRWRASADRIAYMGVRLTDMTRDELLAVAAMVFARAADHGAFGELVPL